jgi:hypothetical protein
MSDEKGKGGKIVSGKDFIANVTDGSKAENDAAKDHMESVLRGKDDVESAKAKEQADSWFKHLFGNKK